MKHMHNIDKSAFRRKAYVGYACGNVWHIKRIGRGCWEARCGARSIIATSLSVMSEKLNNLRK